MHLGSFKLGQEVPALKNIRFIHRQGGRDCARNVTVLVKSIANAIQLLPSILSVSSPHGPPCDVVAFYFVPQLLHLLQNPSLMIPENVVLDVRDPLKPYKSCNAFEEKQCLGVSTKKPIHV
jgi:hypothetical protein